ncbi:MAG TPA: 2'-deoxycytidine 5'-triphosphate deaminase [Candidatus Acidoferrales bacterium]|nr:2'-deoxycytidine 5'-triphosphate deaminase [Candidatus Acidoferrales bacterium]
MAHEQLLFPGVASQGGALAASGVLPSQVIRNLIASGHIVPRKELKAPISEDQIQPASIDLRLGEVAYRVRASFLPGRSFTVQKKIQDLKMSEVDLTRPAVFEKNCVYIVPLAEELFLPDEISAKCNPKSTTGRLDIFTRLITDYGEDFEWVRNGYRGPLYAEVVPRTFSVVLSAGMKLSQMRFLLGDPSSDDRSLRALDRQHGLVYLSEDNRAEAEIEEGLWIRVSTQSDSPADVVAYKARHNAPVIDLSKVNYYEPDDFWELIYPPRSGSLILDPGAFYIIASKERVRVPPQFAAEMVALETSVGEFRIHYAGFFDPGFGFGLNDDIKGTRAVLEVRAHEVPFQIEDGQAVGRLYYMHLLSVPDKVYGATIGSSYQGQALALSKQFKSTARPAR